MIDTAVVKVCVYAALLAGLVYLSYDYGRKVERAKADASQAGDTQIVINRTEEAKATTVQRLEGQEGAQHAYVKQSQADDSRLRDAESANRRLQQRIAALQADLGNRSGDSALAACRTTTAALGGLLGACTTEYVDLGRDAAEDRASGILCEQSYDALIRSGTRPTGGPQSSGSGAGSSETGTASQAQNAPTAQSPE